MQRGTSNWTDTVQRAVSVVWAAVAGVRYLLVVPAVRDKDVVPHLHGEVQSGESMTHSYPQRWGIAGHRCHGSHFLLPLVSLSPPCQREERCQSNKDVKEEQRRGKRVKRGECLQDTEVTVSSAATVTWAKQRSKCHRYVHERTSGVHKQLTQRLWFWVSVLYLWYLSLVSFW